MLKVAMGSGAAEVEEVAAEVTVDTDMVVEGIALVVEMLVVVEVSVVALVVERTEVASVEVEDSSVDAALVVVSVEEALAVDVVSPLVDDVVTEEAELAGDVVDTDTESETRRVSLVTTILGITCSGRLRTHRNWVAGTRWQHQSRRPGRRWPAKERLWNAS